MTFYFVIITVLFSLAVIGEFLSSSRKITSLLSVAILILFAGLRYQTGYDWPAYEAYFSSIVPAKIALCEGLPRLPFLAEPLFSLLNIALKTLTSDVAVLFLVCSGLSLGVLHYSLQKLWGNVTNLWPIYFGVVFLISQMTAVRQGIASSFVILALVFTAKNKNAHALAAFLISIGFHVSTIVFLPLIFLKRFTPAKWINLLLLLLGIICAIFKMNLQLTLFKFISTFSGEWLNSKLSFFLNADSIPLSLGTMGLIAFHFAILGILYLKTDESEKKLASVKIAIWLTLFMIVSHLFFNGLPTIWNRVLFVALPWQISCIFNLKFFSESSSRHKLATMLILFMVGLTSLIYSLSKESSVPYTPYYSIIEKRYFDKEVEGNSRLLPFLIAQETTVKGTISESLLQGDGPKRRMFEPLFKKVFDVYCE